MRLESGADGLEPEEARRRLALHGPNLLPRPKRKSLLSLYLSQFRNPLVYLLLGATAVSLWLGERSDAAFIFIVLQLNAAIGVYQEFRAEMHARALDQLIEQMAVVVRAGQRLRIPGAEVVPGDILQLVSGSRVCADLRLTEARELLVDESLLTGESTPVVKDPEALVAADATAADRGNMLHAGTLLLSGRATGVVTATGSGTQIGWIAESLTTQTPVAPPFVRRLERFGRQVGLLTMLLIVAIGAAQLQQGSELGTVFLTAVALAVAAIPEGLPAAITIALAVASQRMAARRVIVRSLPAVEGLGTCTLIASDKTGTLTCNELTVRVVRLHGEGAPEEPVTIEGQGYSREGRTRVGERPLLPAEQTLLRRLGEAGMLCNEANVTFSEGRAQHLGDTVDVAFLVLAAKLGIDLETLRRRSEPLGAIPYEPHRRFAAIIVHRPGDHAAATTYVKGAAEVVLPMCTDVDQGALLAEVDQMAAEGYRVIAVAGGPAAPGEALADGAPAGLTLFGFVGLIDPVRPEVPNAVTRCRDAGISVRMITGDHPATALAIARQLGIAESYGEVVTGADLKALAGQPVAFDRLVAETGIFARVDPAQKLSIVEGLQRSGEVVTVTGDGVNDAPALAAADLGVAMGKDGTDVARGAADLILTDDNFVSIVAGIEEGRIAYDNVRKLIYLLLATGLGEIVLFLLAIVAGLPLPLSAVQLLWLNLVTNGIQHVALAFEGGEPEVLKRPPRPPREPLFDWMLAREVLIAGVSMGVVAMLFFDWCLEQGMQESSARNLLLLLMVVFENVHVLNARSETRSIFRIPIAANPFLLPAIAAGQGVHIAAMYLPGLSEMLRVEPIRVIDWLLVLGLATSLIVVVETYKALTGSGARSRPDSP